jgi:acyl-CoA dehydrogenase
VKPDQQPAQSAEQAISRARDIALAVAATHAEEVDRAARFPHEAVDALREAKLLGATVPCQFGGLGLDLLTLTTIACTLGAGCASTAMIWAMHQIQVACIARHCPPESYLASYLRDVARNQLLIASITSEVGVGGDIRTSIAAVEDGASPGCKQLSKHGSTVSYGDQSDAFLVTARRSTEAGPQDQVLVLLHRHNVVLQRTGTWNTLGMRGTCSPSYQLSGAFPDYQILPAPFSDICTETMVPFSHILWAACWLGIATDAVSRAQSLHRARSARRETPDLRLSDASTLLQQMRATVMDTARRFSEATINSASMPWMIEMNQLKLSASELVVNIVSLALSICGMRGYTNEGPYALGRHLRDAYAAGAMINNQRLRETNATMQLLVRSRA